MRFSRFEAVLSHERLKRYVDACNQDHRKAMTLYRYNLHLAQDAFSIISCFEVALRNAIDRQLTSQFGADWLRDSIQPGGIFDGPRFRETQRIVRKAYDRLNNSGRYTHTQLLSEMEFGVWKYMFSAQQYAATGQTLLRAVFPLRPRSSAAFQYNNTYIFNELDKINVLRNRIAHHEPICFTYHRCGADTTHIRREYAKILTLFSWMDIDCHSLLYGLDHVLKVSDKIDALN